MNSILPNAEFVHNNSLNCSTDICMFEIVTLRSLSTIGPNSFIPPLILLTILRVLLNVLELFMLILGGKLLRIIRIIKYTGVYCKFKDYNKGD